MKMINLPGMKSKLYLLLIFLICSQIVCGDEITSSSIAPFELETQTGFNPLVNQPLSPNLSTEDQGLSISEDYSKYIEFTAEYEGIFRFQLPQDGVPTVKTLHVKANMMTPGWPNVQVKFWSYNHNTHSFSFLSSSTGALSWEWHSASFDGFHGNASDFIDENGVFTMRMKITSTTDEKSVLLDYLGISLLHDSDANTASPSTPEETEQVESVEDSNGSSSTSINNHQSTKPHPPAVQSVLPRRVSWSNRAWGWYDGGHDNDEGMFVVDVDLFDTTLQEIHHLRESGHYVLCHFNAGMKEEWREDISARRSMWDSTVPEHMQSWDEAWLDVTKLDNLVEIMGPRLTMAVQKGCHAVEPDNVDCHSHYDCYNELGDVETVRLAQIEYNKWQCQRAHELGLGIALKNSEDLVSELHQYYDIAINEECYHYSTCHKYEPFMNASKPVFNVEYVKKTSQWCTHREYASSIMSKWCIGSTANAICKSGEWINCFEEEPLHDTNAGNNDSEETESNNNDNNASSQDNSSSGNHENVPDDGNSNGATDDNVSDGSSDDHDSLSSNANDNKPQVVRPPLPPLPDTLVKVNPPPVNGFLRQDSSWSNRAWGFRQSPNDVLPNMRVVVVDLFDTTDDEIKALRQNNHHVLCSFSAGMRHHRRWDVQGNLEAWNSVSVHNSGGSEDAWLDVTQLDSLVDLINPRIKMAKWKGCSGIEPTDVDCYDHPDCRARIGDRLMVRHAQIRYNKWQCQRAYELGLSISLRDSEDIIPEVVSYYHMATNEGCYHKRTCDLYKPFFKAAKLVMNVEYKAQPTGWCESREHARYIMSKWCHGTPGQNFCTEEEWHNCFEGNTLEIPRYGIPDDSAGETLGGSTNSASSNSAGASTSSSSSASSNEMRAGGIIGYYSLGLVSSVAIMSVVVAIAVIATRYRMHIGSMGSRAMSILRHTSEHEGNACEVDQEVPVDYQPNTSTAHAINPNAGSSWPEDVE